MLSTLSIDNIAVIKRAEINFGAGFCVLTGETGAGKSILIDSINAVLGERTSKDLIREGSENASVSALFTGCSASVKEKLFELGYPLEEDDDLLISRTLSSDGKSNCRINGRPATAVIIRELSKLLVNIHGQHDNQSLLDPSGHYIYIDRMGNSAEIFEKYTVSYLKMNDLNRQLKSINTDKAELERKLELLDYQINELENANITSGERESLISRRNKIQNSEKISKQLLSVCGFLNGNSSIQNGAVSSVSDAAHSLSKCIEYFPELGDTYARLDEIGYELRDIAEQISDSINDIEFSPSETEEIEERLDFLYKLSKKYGADEESMLTFLENAVNERDSLNHSEQNTALLQKELASCIAETTRLANELSESRKETASRFSEKVSTEMEFLNMPNVRFSVDFTHCGLSPTGSDKIEFLLSVNAGEPQKPLSKIASGGELSRIMLAIKSVLADYDDVETLIFDEIDTGISGRAAQKVGNKLKSTAKGRQVICVTHLAQIAAQGDIHLLIEKNVVNERTCTTVTTLGFEERKKELARIIGGETITETTLKSAEEMLQYCLNI